MKNLLLTLITLLGSFTFAQTCNIEQNGVYELNQFGSSTVLFYTAPNNIQNPSADAYSYHWEFTFEDGSVSLSMDRQPQIPVLCSNKVVTARVWVNNGTCTKTITKTFRPKVCGTSELLN